MAEAQAENERAHRRITEHEVRLAANEAQIGALAQLPAIVETIRQKQEALDLRMAAQSDAVRTVQAAVEVEVANRSSVDPSYARPGNGAILRLNTHQKVELPQ
eukprot:2207006-Karenia_brevis.AAC.1